jgi:hypothetical protein
MRFWPFSKRDHVNSVDLVGDGDEADLLEEIEREFGINFACDEALKTLTLGEMEQLVRAKFAEDPKQDLLWKLVCRIVREVSGHRGAIDRDTTFFAKHAKKETNNG